MGVVEDSVVESERRGEREREKGFHDLILNFGCRRRRRWRLTLSARGEIRVAQCVRRVCSCPFCAFSIVDVTLRGRYVWCLAISTEPRQTHFVCFD